MVSVLCRLRYSRRILDLSRGSVLPPIRPLRLSNPVRDAYPLELPFDQPLDRGAIGAAASKLVTEHSACTVFAFPFDRDERCIGRLVFAAPVLHAASRWTDGRDRLAYFFIYPS